MVRGNAAWFFVAAGLTGCKLELQLRKLDTLRGCRFGGLGLTEKPASRHEHANKPQPTKFAAATNPRQNTQHNHASQVLSCSFKPAAPYAQELQIPKTGTPAQQNRYPSNPQGFKFGGLGFVGIVRTHKVVGPYKPQPTTCAAPTSSRFQRALPAPLPSLKPPAPRSRLPECPAGHLGSNNA